jgi:hypothetical protein
MSRNIIVIVDFYKIGANIAEKIYYSISMFSMKKERKKVVLCSIFQSSLQGAFTGYICPCDGDLDANKYTSQQTFEVPCPLLSTRSQRRRNESLTIQFST